MNKKFTIETNENSIELKVGNEKISLFDIIEDLYQNNQKYRFNGQTSWNKLLRQLNQLINISDDPEKSAAIIEQKIRESETYKQAVAEAKAASAIKEQLINEKHQIEIQLNSQITQLKTQATNQENLISNLKNEKEKIEKFVKLEVEAKYKEELLQIQNKTNSLEQEKLRLENQTRTLKLDLEKQFEVEKSTISESIKAELSKKIEQANEEKVRVKAQLEELQKSQDAIIQSKINEVKATSENILLKEKEIIKNQLQSEFENNKKSVVDEALRLARQNWIEKENQYKLDIKKIETDLETEKEKSQQRLTSNIKLIGNQLEDWINNQATQYIVDKDTTFVKSTRKEGTNADFIMRVKFNNEEIATYVIEAKTEIKDSEKKQKTHNKDHYEKLETDRVNNRAEWGILVTELEPDQDFIVRNVSGFDHLIEVRPEFFATIMNMFKKLALDSAEKTQQYALGARAYVTKEKMMHFFNELKSQMINVVVKNLENEFKTLRSTAEILRKQAHKIESSVDKLVSRELVNIKNYFSNDSSLVNSILELPKDNRGQDVIKADYSVITGLIESSATEVKLDNTKLDENTEDDEDNETDLDN